MSPAPHVCWPADHQERPDCTDTSAKSCWPDRVARSTSHSRFRAISLKRWNAPGIFEMASAWLMITRSLRARESATLSRRSSARKPTPCVRQAVSMMQSFSRPADPGIANAARPLSVVTSPFNQSAAGNTDLGSHRLCCSPHGSLQSTSASRLAGQHTG